MIDDPNMRSRSLEEVLQEINTGNTCIKCGEKVTDYVIVEVDEKTTHFKCPNCDTVLKREIYSNLIPKRRNE